MSEMTLRNVCKIYQQNNYAVKDFNLEIKDKEFIIFVGPSGCGKSTTLRMIAGLEEISAGELWIDGNLVNYVEPKDRDLSMVFQNYALYPHMTVYDNMAYALKIRKLPKKEIDKKVRETAKILEIEQLLDRKPGALSGGQRQRVAIGSAIVRKPKAFLMDEPLSNLDAKLRAQMRVELSKLHKNLGTTMIYVTHDQTEAMTLGTRIVVMKDGIVQQVETPKNLYNNPVNKFVAGFIGSPSMNFIDMDVRIVDKKAWLCFGENRLQLPDSTSFFLARKGYQGQVVTAGIRPENLFTEQGLKKALDVNPGSPMTVTVTSREMTGAEVMLYFELDGKQCCARVEPECKTKTGEKVNLYFDLNKLHLFDRETESSILFDYEGEKK